LKAFDTTCVKKKILSIPFAVCAIKFPVPPTKVISWERAGKPFHHQLHNQPRNTTTPSQTEQEKEVNFRWAKYGYENMKRQKKS
jgi:hypothetical protein